MNDPIPPKFDGEDTNPDATPPPARPARKGKISIVPWGALFVLVLYGVGATLYVSASHYLSDEYKVSQLLRDADALLGSENGRNKTTQELEAAANAFLKALLVNPDSLVAHEGLKSIKWRYQERNVKFPERLARRHATLTAQSSLAHRDEGGLFAQMPITPEERYQLESLRHSFMVRGRWAMIGLGLVFAWVVLKGVQRSKERERLREAAARTDKGTAEY